MMNQEICLQQYLGKEMECNCGKEHRTDLKKIDIEEGAVKRLPGYIKALDYKKVFLVADVHTWAAAGKEAEEEMHKAGLSSAKYVFEDEELIPDEKAVGALLEVFPKDADLILAVGSGTLNDLCKFFSFQLDRDYMVLATAPSMDGFVSVGAALIHNYVKTTYQAHVPVAVIGDPAILAKAPMEMIVAGLGDILGKYTCLLDWKMAHLIEGEYYCGKINDMVRESIQIVVEESGKIKERDPKAIKHLMEALVLTGVAMSFVGNSRPASGSEHHLSHYWEMQFQMEGKKPVLHGVKVGIGMLAVVKMYQKLLQEKIDFAKAKNAEIATEKWKEKVVACYKDAAPGILALEEQCGKNTKENRNRRLAVMEAHWDEITNMIQRELPELESLENLMESMGEPTNPAQIGVSSTLVEDAVILAKEVRDRFTILQVLWDLGLLDQYAKDIADYFAAK